MSHAGHAEFRGDFHFALKSFHFRLPAILLEEIGLDGIAENGHVCFGGSGADFLCQRNDFRVGRFDPQAGVFHAVESDFLRLGDHTEAIQAAVVEVALKTVRTDTDLHCCFLCTKKRFRSLSL